MNRFVLTGRWFFAIAFTIFAIQHFMFAAFVATLVPAWIPWHLFWTFFTALAFIAVAISFVTGRFVFLSALMMGVMLGLFIILLHIPLLISHPEKAMSWTRAVQDTAIMAAAFMFTGARYLIFSARVIFAVAMMFLGLQHFAHETFVTVKVPPYLPAPLIWDYVVGALIIAASVCILFNFRRPVAALVLCGLIFTFMMLYNIPFANSTAWTTAMLELAIAAGALATVNGGPLSGSIYHHRGSNTVKQVVSYNR